MRSFLAYPVDQAKEALENEGFNVLLVEVRSKKGIADSDSKRVIRQRLTADKTVELCFSYVVTNVNLADE